MQFVINSPFMIMIIIMIIYTVHLSNRQEISPNFCSVKVLRVVLIGAWLYFLKDMTNCVQRKSKLTCHTYFLFFWDSYGHQ